MAKAEVPIPGKGHEDVGDGEKDYSPHILILDAYSVGPGDGEWQGFEEGTKEQGSDDGARGKSGATGRGDRAGLPRGGTGRGEVELMAVSKTYPAETIAEAAALGMRLFGENRVQEFAC